ncbi:MAG: indole-3-glycerol phosphate synthase TrpC [Desulfobacteraceae bacterium]|nr:indole-3-glycerol phosphate synthase TrpC [Desulfobacteraceae bacterium]
MTILDKIVEDKQQQVAQAARKISEQDLRSRIADMDWTSRQFENRLSNPGPGGVNVIAEVKRASPSKGDICTGLDAKACARQYEQGGAAAISVLTDMPYFKGDLTDMKKARAAVDIPVLRKEFILYPYQVYESRMAGADAVLLIVRILTPSRLRELLNLAHSLDMGALVEIHSPKDYQTAHEAGARLIGINNRNLATFDTSLERAVAMKGLLAPEEIPVAASGIKSRQDIEDNLKAGIFNFLIGESLVRAENRVDFLKNLIRADSP